MTDAERVPYEPDFWDEIIEWRQEYTPPGEWHMRRFARAIARGMQPPEDTMAYLGKAFTSALKELDESKEVVKEDGSKKENKNRGNILNKHMPITGKPVPLKHSRELQDSSRFQQALEVEILMLRDGKKDTRVYEKVKDTYGEVADKFDVDDSVVRKSHKEFEQKAHNVACIHLHALGEIGLEKFIWDIRAKRNVPSEKKTGNKA